MAVPAFQRVWKDVKRFCGNPRLAEPKVYTKKSEADRIMGAGSIAYFNFSDKSISVHYPNVVSKLGKGLLAPVEMHEVGHHKFCPYDLRMLLRMINEADKILQHPKNAKYFENILSDIYVNTHTIKKGGKSVIDVYKAMGRDSKNALWNVYMRTCERLWNLSPETLSANVNSVMEKDSKTLTNLVNNTLYSSQRWPAAMGSFTDVMKKYIQDKKQKKKGLIDEHSAKDFTDSKNFEKDMRGLAKEFGFKQYKRVLAAAGIGKKKNKKGQKDAKQPAPKDTGGNSSGAQPGIGRGDEKVASRLFYRDLAGQYQMEIEKTRTSKSDSVPHSPVEWDVSDDVNTLDAEFSIRQFGKIIPGESAYKWKKKDGSYGVPDKNYPDLLIVLDSSCSMPDPVAEMSVPVLSSMIAAKTAFSVDSLVGVVNFSVDYSVLDYTGRQLDVENELMRYFNGGTVIPGKAILKAVEKNNNNKQHILIITDAGIGNLDAEFGNLEAAVRKAGAGGTIFLAGCSGAQSSVLEKAGYAVKPVARVSDLVDLAIETAGKLYGV